MVIENDTIRSGTHDFLLTFHSNHRPISHHYFRDKRRFPSKIANFPTHVYFAPGKGGTLGIGYRRRGQKKTRSMGLRDGRKSFKLGLTVQTQYRRVTDRRTRCRSKDRAMLCVARVKMQRSATELNMNKTVLASGNVPKHSNDVQ